MTPKARKTRFEALAKLGCCVCLRKYGNRSDAHLHHLTGVAYRGMGMRANDLFTIPLCPKHHTDGGFGVAVHAGMRKFEENFGTQRELLEWTNRQIA